MKRLHGSYTKKKAAEDKAAKVPGAKVKRFDTSRGVRYVVMSEKGGK